MKRALRIFAVVLLLLGAAWGVSRFYGGGKPSEQQPPRGPVAVVTEAVQTVSLSNAVRAVGSLVAGESADIHAEIAGQISEILFEEGQPVKKGDVLIQMDRSLLETELARAKAALDAAAANFARDDKLKKSGFVAAQQWDATRAALDAARAEVANAEIRLEKATIRAPFGGVAGLRSFSKGDFTTAGAALTSVVSIDPLKLEFTIPEKNYGDIRAGQQIAFAVDAFPGENFPGEVYAVDPRVDPDNRNFTVKATVPNSGGRLRPGMYARIEITTATRGNAMTIPEEAIMPRGESSFVYAVRGGKAVLTEVTLGARETGRVEVLGGLSPDDRVVTAGHLKLKDGAAVAEQPAAPQDVSPSAGK